MKFQHPTVSVVLPTYNRANLLDRAIETVLDQTYGDFELLIVDDGSIDDTEDVVASFDDSRLRYLRHPENRGAAAARNTGIEESSGAFIAFQDSDDEWHPDKLAKQMSVFVEAPPDVGVVYTGFWKHNGKETNYYPSSGITSREGNIETVLKWHNFITTQAAIVRAECFEEVGGFDERLPRLQDWELWLRISREYEFRLVDEGMVDVYDTPGSISNDTDALVKARKIILEKHGDQFDSAALAHHEFRLGHASLKTNRWRQGIRYIVAAVQTHPRPLYSGALVLALFGPGLYNRVLDLYKRVG